MDKKSDNLILLGVIKSAHGIKGDIIIRSYTDPVDNIIKLPLVDKHNLKYQIKLIRIDSKGQLICRMDGCNSRNDAELLSKTELFCLRANLKEIEEDGEFYIQDLVGLSILDTSKNKIGSVVNIHNYGAGNLVEIQFLDQKSTELLPFTKEIFPEITKEYAIFLAPKLV
jgi:16S rRNA processing protein RimM